MRCSRSPGGGIAACLAGFQATPRGKAQGDLARRVSRPTPKGEVEGDLARGVSMPTPKGKVEGDLAGGESPGPHLGRSAPREATPAGSTHATGMHSC